MRRRVNPAGLIPADPEPDLLALRPEHPGGGPYAAQPQVHRDPRTGPPAGARPEVQTAGAEPVGGDLGGGPGGDRDGALDGRPVGDRAVELQRDDHAGADGGAVLGREEADEAVRRHEGGEGGVAGRAAPVPVHGHRVDRVAGGGREAGRPGRAPAQPVRGDPARHRRTAVVLDAADGDPLQPPVGHPYGDAVGVPYVLRAVPREHPDRLLRGPRLAPGHRIGKPAAGQRHGGRQDGDGGGRHGGRPPAPVERPRRTVPLRGPPHGRGRYGRYGGRPSGSPPYEDPPLHVPICHAAIGHGQTNEAPAAEET